MDLLADEARLGLGNKGRAVELDIAVGHDPSEGASVGLQVTV